MNTAITKSRPGWVKYTLLAALAVVGLTGGYYFSEQSNDLCLPPDPTPIVTPMPEGIRFTLSSFDAKDQMEAPELAADGTGRVFLVWPTQISESEKTLLLSLSDDAAKTFAPPREITRSAIVHSVAQMRGKTVKRALRMMAHIVARENALHLAWTEALPNGLNVRTVVATSTDGGTTFGSPFAVHRDNGGRTTFTSVAVGADNMLACSWLDNRNGAQQVYAAIRQAGQHAFGQEMLVHSGDDEGRGVCPCCPTASLVAPDGTVYVAFRNVANGHRDIAIGILRPGQMKFEAPISVMPPTWKFNGCPHDGPSMALVGDRLHIVWMDARTGSQRCYHAQAQLGDLKFTSTELHAIPVGTQGNAKLCLDAKGGLHVVWEESTAAPPAGNTDKHQHEPAIPKLGSGGRAIQYALLGANGRFGVPQAVAPREGAFQTRPALIVASDGRVVVAWNELDETGKAIVVTSINPGGQP